MDLASASTAGFVVTAREGDGYENLVGGVDGNLRFTPSDRLQVQVLGSRTDYPDTEEFEGEPFGEFEGMAYDAELNHDSSSFDWWVAYRQIDDGYRSDMGYRPQTNYRQTRGGWSHAWRAEAGSWYTSLSSGFGYVHNEEMGGEPLDSFFDFWANYNGPMRSEFNVYGMLGSETYKGTEFDKRIVDANAAFWPTGSVLTRLSASFGDNIDYENGRQASRVNVEPMVYFTLASRFYAMVSHEYEQMEVDEGKLYTANVTYAQAAYQFTRRTFLRAILQHAGYDYETELYSDGRDSRESYFASQVLFSYKINPQTVLYLGYSDAYRGSDEFDLTQSDRTFFAKVGYAWVL